MQVEAARKSRRGAVSGWSVARALARRSNGVQAHATEDAAWRTEARKQRSPTFGLDVVDVGVLALPYRLHDLADVDAVLDHRFADRHVLQRDLVADWNILPAF